MRGYGISVLPLTAGCRKDIENLLKMYKEKKTLRYEPFIDLFERSKFFTIFTGRMSPADLFEFSEKLLQLSISYAMSYRERKSMDYIDESAFEDSVSFPDMQFNSEITLQERLFGIYLTYTLYFVQPDSYVAQVRITPNQMTDLICFLNERLIPEYHVDAFVALFKLVNGGAFRLYAFEKEHNPLLHRSFDLLEQDCSDSDETEMEEYSILKGLRDDVILAQANIICNRYLDAKEKANLSPKLSINLVSTTVSEIYNDILKNTDMGLEESRFSKRSTHYSGYKQRYFDVSPAVQGLKQKIRMPVQQKRPKWGMDSPPKSKIRTSRRKRGRSKTSTYEMEYGDFAVNVAAKKRVKDRREKIADRLLDKIQKAHKIK